MEGLEKIKAQVMEKEDTRNILNKLKLNVNQHCDRISNEVSSVSNYLMREFILAISPQVWILITNLAAEQQEGVNKNSIAVNKELVAFKKAADEGIKMESRDKKIIETFVSFHC
jgi:hypothetical protein